ncbi:MAG TPA: hypothetical protein VF597_04290 [Candidatus Saccharimonadales bacterium]
MLRTYTLQSPDDSLAAFRRRLERAISSDNKFELTVREQRDELRARRRPMQPEKFQLKLLSIRFGPDGHIICEVIGRNMTGRVDFASDPLTLMTVSHDDGNVASP